MAKQELLPVDLIGGGRGVILSSASFARLGLFDASAFPHYYADHDFYLRARRQGIPLYVATRAYVDIDDSHTSLANRPEALTLRKFIHSLRSTQSHRNLRDITTLFRRHYPIPRLYLIGVMLYTGRYLLVYLIKRSKFLLGARRYKRNEIPLSL